MSKLRFPPLRITEEKMTNKQILETFNTAFGGEAVLKVAKSKNTRIIHIDQENEARKSEWKDFYDALDKRGVWIKAEYLGDEVYLNSCFEFSTTPQGTGKYTTPAAKTVKLYSSLRYVLVVAPVELDVWESPSNILTFFD